MYLNDLAGYFKPQWVLAKKFLQIILWNDSEQYSCGKRDRSTLIPFPAMNNPAVYSEGTLIKSPFYWLL